MVAGVVGVVNSVRSRLVWMVATIMGGGGGGVVTFLDDRDWCGWS